jgi:beta-lactamase regulating signal transducer with metallopeptidase domain
MIPTITSHLAPTLAAYVAEPALRSLIFAGAAGLAVAAFRPKNVSTRLAIWTAVLCAALAMPVLGWLLPAISLPLPVVNTGQRPTTAVSGVATSSEVPMAMRPHRFPFSRLQPAGQPGRRAGEGPVAVLADPASSSVQRELMPANHCASVTAPPFGRNDLWRATLVWLYLLFAAVLFARFLLGVILRLRLRRGSDPIDDARALTVFRQSARNLAIGSLPLLAQSNAVASPVTVGVRCPAILLPPEWRDWQHPKLSAVLAHELSHVKRRDALIRALSAIHSCLFWFSPLAWWLDCKLAELAEEASDEAALRAGADAAYYAEVLLDFFAALGAAGRRARWQTISLVQGSRAERRVDRIFHASVTARSGLGKPALCLLLACGAPAACFVAALRPSTMRAQTAPAASREIFTQSPQPNPAPRPQQNAITPPAPARVIPPVPPAPATPNPQFGKTAFPKGIARQAPPAPSAMPQPASEPLPPPAMLAALPPLPASPPPPEPRGTAPSDSASRDNAWSFNGDEGVDYAIVSGKSLFMSGSQGDRDEVEALRRKIKGDFIWFRHDAKSYVIRDPATVQEAALFFMTEQNLATEQAVLGRQQAALGKEQAAVGQRTRSTPVQVPSDLVAQLEELEARIKELGINGDQRQLDRLQEQLGHLQGELAQVQAEVARRGIGEEMRILARQQETVGREQGRLGREQARMARQASRKMRRLIDRSLARGLAKPAP